MAAAASGSFDFDENLLDQFFSYSEDVDLYRCVHDGRLSNLVMAEDVCLEELAVLMLEMLDSERAASAISVLYAMCVSSDEKFNHLFDPGHSSPDERARLTCKILYHNGGMLVICQNVYNMLNRLANREKAEESPGDCQLEFEIRLTLNMLFLLIFYNRHEEDFRDQISDPFCNVEGFLLLGIKLSLDIQVIPIKKIAIIMRVYLYILFGEVDKSNKKHSHLTKEIYDSLEGEEPRFHIKSPTPTEAFYKRHMTKENPLPHIVVVGLLRVLLTTCPNAVRSSPGIDLNREWTSPFLLLQEFPDEFVDYEPQHEALRKKKEAKLDGDGIETDPYEDMKEGAGGEENPEGESGPAADYSIEIDRHRTIVAKTITEIFLFLLRHFKASHIMQASYLSQLVVDANGALVILKFLNQDLAKLEFGTHEAALPWLKDRIMSLEQVLDEAVVLLLKLMYKLCNRSPERIRSFLIQYKAPFIMKRIFNNFEDPECQKAALKLLKVQVKFLHRKWKSGNMKVVSSIYDLIPIKKMDDWMAPESTETDTDSLSQDDIRKINNDFNYYNYWQFYERKEEKAEKLCHSARINWSDVTVQPSFFENYETWLEDEVWGYYD